MKWEISNNCGTCKHSGLQASGVHLDNMIAVCLAIEGNPTVQHSVVCNIFELNDRDREWLLSINGETWKLDKDYIGNISPDILVKARET